MDGTILNSHHQLTDNICAALGAVARQGIRVILVSARSPSSMVRYAEQLGLNGMMVALNGVLVVDQARNTLFHRQMVAADIRTILALCQQYQLIPNLFAGFDWYVEQINPWIENQIAVVGFRPRAGAFSDELLRQIEKLLIMGQPDQMQRFHADLLQRKLQVTAAFSRPAYCEITPAGVSKATGLDYVCRQLNILPGQVVAIGDNFNDVEMLTYAGLGVAMGNAPPEVQAAADLVIGSNDDDGVAQFVREWLL